MRRCVYAGSFDPITNGHLWMVAAGARIFDELVVAIGVNPDKRYTFALERRRAMLEQAVLRFGNVKVDTFEGLYLVDYAQRMEAGFILRGIRNEHDYAFERSMRNVNADLQPEVTTVFLIPPREMAEVSSSFVKGLVGSRGWPEVVERYVPHAVLEAFLEEHAP